MNMCQQAHNGLPFSLPLKLRPHKVAADNRDSISFICNYNLDLSLSMQYHSTRVHLPT